jgi:hypothetical protein
MSPPDGPGLYDENVIKLSGVDVLAFDGPFNGLERHRRKLRSVDRSFADHPDFAIIRVESQPYERLAGIGPSSRHVRSGSSSGPSRRLAGMSGPFMGGPTARPLPPPKRGEERE